MTACIFCKIAKGNIPCHKIWGDENYLAFLDINPEVHGMTLVIPKKHSPSYFVDTKREVLSNLIDAAKTVAKILDAKLESILKTKLVFEGLDVDHLHAKLYPMYKRGEEPVNNSGPKYLAELAQRLRE